MDVAALIVSVLALVVAGASVAYTRQQAHAAERTAANDQARRHVERTPTLDVDIKPLNLDRERLYQRLVVRLTSPEPLTGVDVEIRDTPGLILSPNQDGVSAGAPAPILTGSRRADPSQVLLGLGDEVTWQLEVDPTVRRPTRARLVLRLIGPDDSWVVEQEARVPSGPPVIVVR